MLTCGAAPHAEMPRVRNTQPAPPSQHTRSHRSTLQRCLRPGEPPTNIYQRRAAAAAVAP
eukprot:6136227-Prymnesium_polylepis.1